MSESSHGDWCSTCVGCGGLIQDQFILRVSPDLSWHAACLKCSDCGMMLDEKHTCFVRDGKTFCKKDYIRLYGARCSACQTVFTKNDFVMRAKTKMFHLECFRCAACRRHLVPGDEFALHGEGIYCKEDHELVERCEDNNNISKTGIPRIKSEMDDFRDNLSDLGRDDDLRDDGLSSVDIKSETETLRPDSPDDLIFAGGDLGELAGEGRRMVGEKERRSRAGKVRTVLTEKQLNILKTCFSANPRPDALMKEQLTEMTGLSQRVIRVWFQNKRCKEKKRMREVTKDHQKLGYGSMNGISMVATSPVRQDSPVGVNPVDITGYQPPWKSLTEFALRGEPPDHSNPHFQSLVSQMHGYDPHFGPGPGGLPPHLYPPHPDLPLMLGPPPQFPPEGPPGSGPPFPPEGPPHHPPGPPYADHCDGPPGDDYGGPPPGFDGECGLEKS